MPRPSPATANHAGGFLLARVMAQVEKNIDLVYRLQGLHAMAKASHRHQLQQALHPVNAVSGIAKGAAGQAVSLGAAGAVAGS